ncbi:MBL fold metallo-hydrolase [Rhodohalobacter sp.]|uniref:MBL fold metallo-hydrolase n=1 Tax=Rhodohalobacter sp. TaxID=1974210 RepID=UPI0035660F9A
MDVKQFTVGPFAENTYLITKDHKAILVDPGFFDPREFTVFKNGLEESNTELIAVVLTHAHIDHIAGLDKVLKEFDVPVYLNHSDLYLWNNYPDQAKRFGFRVPGFDFTPEEMPEQQGFSIGPFIFDVLFTPGHSPDHVSLYFKDDQLLIAGDALFRESIGRTDLYKGDLDLLTESIRKKLYTLPEETKVLPGHGPSTTIGYEKTNNNFVKA